MDDIQPLHSTTDHLDPTLGFLTGTAASVSGLVVGFPFDTGELNPIQISRSSLVHIVITINHPTLNQVKYRFQNPSLGVRYHSTLHALVTIMREERLHGLYKDISSPLVHRVGPQGDHIPHAFLRRS